VAVSVILQIATMIHVRYHAYLKDRIGLSMESYVLKEGAFSVGSLLDAFLQRHPELAALSQSLHVAVNDHIVSRETLLNEGDRVDLMPPFGGG
jgi:molybdopterin converting factor small subunit